MPTITVKHNGSAYEYRFAQGSKEHERGFWSGISGPDRNMIPSILTQNKLRSLAIEAGAKNEDFIFKKIKPVYIAHPRAPKIQDGIKVFGSPQNLAHLAEIERKLNRVIA